MKNEELKLGYSYNKQILKYHSKSFYISTLLLPRDRQKAVFALYGFCRFADNLIDKPRNRSSEELTHEIHYLEREMEIAYRTQASEHPVINVFIDIAMQYHIPIEYPLDLFKGLLMDVEDPHFNTFDDLYVYCYRVAGVVGLMMTHILGYSDEQAFEYASKLGIAMQLTNILRDIQEDKNNNRIYIPQDEMDRFKVTRQDIETETYSSQIKELVQFSADRAHQYYEEALPGIRILDNKCQFAIYSASAIYRTILDKIKEHDYNPFKGRVYVSQTKKVQIILANYFNLKFDSTDGKQ